MESVFLSIIFIEHHILLIKSYVNYGNTSALKICGLIACNGILFLNTCFKHECPLEC